MGRRGEKKREVVHPEVYLYILISLTLKAFNPKLYTLTINEKDFLCIVVFKACFCSAKTQEKQTGSKAFLKRQRFCGLTNKIWPQKVSNDNLQFGLK